MKYENKIKHKPSLDPFSLTFSAMLRTFNEIIKEVPDKAKSKLLALKEQAKITLDLNLRQTEAIVARCDNYINNEYGNTKTESNLSYYTPASPNGVQK